MVSAGDADGALALALTLRVRPGARLEVGRLAAGIVAGLRGYQALAWRDLCGPARSSCVLRWAPEEFVRAGLARSRRRRWRRLGRGGRRPDPPELPADGVAADASVRSSATETASSHRQALFARFDERGRRRQQASARPWWCSATGWLALGHRGPRRTLRPAGRRTAAVSFAIMDYGHPSRTRASNNIGDHVQSIASLGHLVRHQGLTLPRAVRTWSSWSTSCSGRVRRSWQLRRRRAPTSSCSRSTATPRRTPRSRRTPGRWPSAGTCTAIFDMSYGFPFHPNLCRSSCRSTAASAPC